MTAYIDLEYYNFNLDKKEKKRYLENIYISKNKYKNEFFDFNTIEITSDKSYELAVIDNRIVEIKFNINNINNSKSIKDLESFIVFDKNFKNPSIGIITSNEFLNTIYYHFINYYYKYLIYFLRDNILGLNILNLIKINDVKIYSYNNGENVLNIKNYDINYSFSSPFSKNILILAELMTINDILNKLVKLNFSMINVDEFIIDDLLNNDKLLNIDLLNKFKYLLVNICNQFNINYDDVVNININDILIFNNTLNINKLENTNLIIVEYLKNKFNNGYINELSDPIIKNKIISIFNTCLKYFLISEKLYGHSFYYFYYIYMLIKISTTKPTMIDVDNYNQIMSELRINRFQLIYSNNTTILFPMIFFNKIMMHKMDLKKIIDNNNETYGIYGESGELKNTFLSFTKLYDFAVDFIEIYFLKNKSQFIKNIVLDNFENINYYNLNDLIIAKELDSILVASNFYNYYQNNNNNNYLNNNYENHYYNYFDAFSLSSYLSIATSQPIYNFVNSNPGNNNNLFIKLNNDDYYLQIFIIKDYNKQTILYGSYFWANCAIIPYNMAFYLYLIPKEKKLINYQTITITQNTIDLIFKNNLIIEHINNNKNIYDQYVDLLYNNRLFLNNSNYYFNKININQKEYNFYALYLWLSNKDMEDNVIVIEAINNYKLIIEERTYSISKNAYIYYHSLKDSGVLLNRYNIIKNHSLYCQYNNQKNNAPPFYNNDGFKPMRVYFKINFYIPKNTGFNVDSCFNIKKYKLNDYLKNNIIFTFDKLTLPIYYDIKDLPFPYNKNSSIYLYMTKEYYLDKDVHIKFNKLTLLDNINNNNNDGRVFEKIINNCFLGVVFPEKEFHNLYNLIDSVYYYNNIDEVFYQTIEDHLLSGAMLKTKNKIKIEYNRWRKSNKFYVVFNKIDDVDLICYVQTESSSSDSEYASHRFIIRSSDKAPLRGRYPTNSYVALKIFTDYNNNIKYFFQINKQWEMILLADVYVSLILLKANRVSTTDYISDEQIKKLDMRLLIPNENVYDIIVDDEIDRRYKRLNYSTICINNFKNNYTNNFNNFFWKNEFIIKKNTYFKLLIIDYNNIVYNEVDEVNKAVHNVNNENDERNKFFYIVKNSYLDYNMIEDIKDYIKIEELNDNYIDNNINLSDLDEAVINKLYLKEELFEKYNRDTYKIKNILVLNFDALKNDVELSSSNTEFKLKIERYNFNNDYNKYVIDNDNVVDFTNTIKINPHMPFKIYVKSSLFISDNINISFFLNSYFNVIIKPVSPTTQPCCTTGTYITDVIIPTFPD